MTFRVRLQFTILVALLGLAVASCSKPKAPDVAQSSPTSSKAQSTPTPSAPSAEAGAAACTLLTSEEIQAVQGEALKGTKPSQRSAAGLLTAQCYFELPTTSNSIVLTVTLKAEGGRNPSESWEDIFHREATRKKEEEEEGEKKPLKVEGVGDEAYWTGTRVGGALYVLKGNSYIRISVGGAGDQAEKMEKSKKLAESVVKRL